MLSPHKTNIKLSPSEWSHSYKFPLYCNLISTQNGKRNPEKTVALINYTDLSIQPLFFSDLTGLTWLNSTVTSDALYHITHGTIATLWPEKCYPQAYLFTAYSHVFRETWLSDGKWCFWLSLSNAISGFLTMFFTGNMITLSDRLWTSL